MNFLGPLSALAGSFTWALGIDVYSELSKKYSPSVVNFSRATVAAPLFLIAFLTQSSWQGSLETDLLLVNSSHFFWLILSTLGSYAVGDLIFMKSSLSPLGPSGALALASVYPIWSALIGVFFKNESLSAIAFVGLLIIVAGTIGVILSSQQSRKKIDAYEVSLATAATLALFTSLIWSMNIYAVSHIQELPTTLSNLIRMIAALLLCPLFGFLILGARPRLMELSDFKKSLPIFVLEGFGGSIFFIYGVANSSMTVGAVFTSLAPVLAVPIAYFRHGTHLSIKKVSSVLIIVAGLWLLIFS